MSSPNRSSTPRLIELDSLRGIAAMLVVLFHYTTRYNEVYGHTTPPAVFVPWGKYGVDLFFMISGFVIFMTLHRVTRPMDFVVSRFSRLFPAYWAAIVLSFTLTHLMALPGKTVSAGTAALNLMMIHGLFKIPDVDGVYWTLEIELIFYGLALFVFVAKLTQKVHFVFAVLIGLRLLAHLAETFAGLNISWTLSHLLILPYVGWFACGIMVYRQVTAPTESPKKDLAVMAFAVLQLGIVEGPGIGAMTLGLCGLLWAAASGRLQLLRNPILAWLGSISYTLYLLHENIGWGVIMHSERVGIPPNLAILLAIAVCLTLASALTWLVERPAMAWIRSAYRKRPVPA